MLRSYALGLLLIIVSSISWANPIKVAQMPTFIDPNTISIEVLPPPPEADSLTLKMDTTILMWEQNSRTYYDLQRAWGSVTLEPSYFNQALNARFEESRFPQLYKLMKTVMADARLYVDAFKDHYKRARPFDADPNIKPAIPLEISYSYPSGHGTRGMTLALVLAEIFPARKEVILQTGLTLGQDRIIGGVHYPSDIQASVTLAQALAKAIINSETFKTQVKAAQAEIDQIAKYQ